MSKFHIREHEVYGIWTLCPHLTAYGVSVQVFRNGEYFTCMECMTSADIPLVMQKVKDKLDTVKSTKGYPKFVEFV